MPTVPDALLATVKSVRVRVLTPYETTEVLSAALPSHTTAMKWEVKYGVGKVINDELPPVGEAALPHWIMIPLGSF